MRRTLAAATVSALLVSGLASTAAARPINESRSGGLGPEVEATLASLAPGDMATVVVTLSKQTNLAGVRGATRAARLKGTITALQATANASQVPLRALLRARTAQGMVARVTPLWISNAISVTATAQVIQDLAARSDVASVTPNDVRLVPTTGIPEANLTAVDAPAVWDLGYTGQGVVVASMDTGVDVSHPDLAARWRGGGNSWYDPYGQHPGTPTDLSGHGTATVGVMVGGDSSGPSIGMAPGARWIAAKIFNDVGGATATAVHQAFQWALDPDRDPNTPDAPQVVNGSWSIGAGPGCDLSFQPDLQALRAAGILPIFAAGNYGSSGSTSVSPANYPEAIAVGAVNNNDLVYSSSSRGPSACGGRSGVFPDLVAPGVDVLTTDRYGLYQRATGTSLSAPHATGALALLLSSMPGLSADRAQAALDSTAFDLGPAGPDAAYGNGRLDVAAAYQWLQEQPDFGVALAPSEVTVAGGEIATYTVQVTPMNGFAADVSLSLTGLSGGRGDWTFAPAVLMAGSGASQLTVTTSSAIPPGNHPLTVIASSGTTSRTATATLTTSAPTGGDLSGPTTTTPTLTPSLTSGTGTTGADLHATGDDSGTGGSMITAAEYFIDTLGANGLGSSMTVNPLAPIASLDAMIPAATINALAQGTHVVWVHSQDAAGNWGPAVTVNLVVDRTAPTTAGVSASPNPNNGILAFNTSTPAVRVTATTLFDPIAGGVSSNISAAELFIDTVSIDGTGIPLTATDGTFNSASEPGYADIPLATISQLTHGNHTISVHAKDAAGNWGSTATTTLLIDKVRPTVSGGTATPNPTLGATSVTLSATATDTSTAVTRAEWFTGADPGAGSGTSMTVNGTGPWSLSTSPIDVSSWNEGAYTLSVRARDAAGNWSPPSNTVLNVRGPLSFSTLGNTNPPGVAGTADDADVYRWSGAAYSRSIDVTAIANPLPAGANVDGFTRVDTTHFYLSFSADTTTVPGLGNVQDEDVVHYNAGTWSVYFDGTARGLTAANQDLDAISIVGGTLYFSTLGNTNPPGVGGIADDADIYSWNGTTFARVWDATANGLAAAANVDGFVRVDATHHYMSFSSATTTLPVLGAVQDEDVIYNNNGVRSVYFDGSAHGLTADNLDIDAFDVP